MGSEPYASVIIPSHNRDYTLDLAVASVQAQTVRDIEIILALDRASDALKRVAFGLAEGDTRVRVLDMSKAPRNGSANRDRAVMAARGERIFYTDDDDLWLPDHVATLGRLLDDSDVAWSASLSASLSGDLHAGFADYGLDAMRACLRNDSLKIIFDTHLAHRKDAYMAAGRPWANDALRTVVNLTVGLAAPGLRWRGTSRPTALSIHGGGRRHLTPAARRQELIDWAARLTLATRDGLMADARPEWYLQRAWRGLKAMAPESGTALYAAMGLAEATDGWLWTQYQRATADIWFELVHGRAETSSILTDMLPRLMDPLLGSSPQRSLVGGLLEASLGRSGALRLVAEARPENPYHGELMALLHSFLLRKARRPGEAMAIVQPWLAAPAHFPVEIWFEAAETAQAMNDVAAWVDYAGRAAEIRPDSAHVAASLALARLAGGDRQGAQAARDRLMALNPSEDALRKIAAAFGQSISRSS
ncbi:MAG: glycosyltransferase family 2 protein [Asticcacaulis sp.]|nr:glycosyltransferase family 2 protein [Asticcacaulis sp.]